MLQAEPTFIRITAIQSSVTITCQMLKFYLNFEFLAKKCIFISKSFVKNSENLLAAYDEAFS